MHHDFFAWVRLLLLIILILAFAFWATIVGSQSKPEQPEQPEASETEQKEPIYVTQAESLEIIPLKAEAAPEPTISDPTEETTPATEAATIATEPPTEEATIPTEQPVEEAAVEEETIPTETAYPYTEEELDYLALVIYQEAGGDRCSDETRLMVGTVVMNRVEDDRFPDNIRDVILQRGQYGRLYWTGPTWPSRRWNKGEAHAVERAYAIAERILNGERAFGKDVVFQAEFVQGEIIAHQDGFYFCR